MLEYFSEHGQNVIMDYNKTGILESPGWASES